MEQSERYLREQLFDETLQKQQEQLLLRRIQMATACMFTTFPEYAASIRQRTLPLSTDDFPDPYERTSQEAHALHLRQEALSARDYMVLATLDNVKEIEELRKHLNDVTRQCRSLQQENRVMWKELLQLRENEEHARRTNSAALLSEKLDRDDNQSATIHKEIVLLENALLHTIAGSGIDWHSNVRLRQALERLEKEEGA